jgi:septum formation protein
MRKIILASGSPRRQQLLTQAGITFTAVPSDFEEWLDDSRPVEDMACELALGKARAVARQHPDALVIGSDTIVTLHGRQLGKQPDAATTRTLLREMSGQSVEVVTAVALVCKETGLEEAEVARGAIVYAEYGDDAIDRFLASNEWQDKAGATAIQSPHTPPIDHLEGDPETTLGLPTALLRKMLERHDVKTQTMV